jgi:hypothetical protein
MPSVRNLSDGLNSQQQYEIPETNSEWQITLAAPALFPVAVQEKSERAPLILQTILTQQHRFGNRLYDSFGTRLTQSNEVHPCHDVRKFIVDLSHTLLTSFITFYLLPNRIKRFSAAQPSFRGTVSRVLLRQSVFGPCSLLADYSH